MKLFSLFLLLNINYAWSCNNAIDDSKVVLFLNANGSVNEVREAREAACSVGKRFVEIPIVNAEVMRRNNERTEAMVAQQNALYERISNRELSAEDRDTAMAEYDRLHSDYRSTLEPMDTLSPDSLRAEIKNLAGQGVAVDTLIASGHDGGGSISGTTGGINKFDINEIMHEEYADRPDLLDQFNNVMLWGCYTTTKHEVNFWKGNFPGLDIIAGFLGSGPSDEKLASRTIMSDIILKADHLSGLEDDANLKREIERIENLIYTLPGIFIDTGDKCDNRGHYYSISANYDENGSLTGITKESDSYTIDTNSCDYILSNMRMDLENYSAMLNGYIPIPENTSTGELRAIYNKVRENEHCLLERGISGDQVGLLLFYNGVVDNFMNTFSEELQELPASEEETKMKLSQEIDTIIAEVRLELSSRGLSERESNEIRQKLYGLNRFKAFALQSGESFLGQESLEANLKDRYSLNHILSKTQYLSDISANLGDDILSRMPTLRSVNTFHRLATRHLNRLDTDCMDFLEWHEQLPGETAVSNCR